MTAAPRLGFEVRSPVERERNRVIAHRFFEVALVALTLSVATPVLAHADGKIGNATSGCQTCHGFSSVNPPTVTLGGLADDNVLLPDQSALLLHISTNENGGPRGVGLDVKLTQGGQGIALIALDADTQVLSGELTHIGDEFCTSGRRYFDESGETTFQVGLPVLAPGDYRLSFAVNDVDDSCSPGGDRWMQRDVDFTVLGPPDEGPPDEGPPDGGHDEAPGDGGEVDDAGGGGFVDGGDGLDGGVSGDGGAAVDAGSDDSDGGPTFDGGVSGSLGACASSSTSSRGTPWALLGMLMVLGMVGRRR